MEKIEEIVKALEGARGIWRACCSVSSPQRGVVVADLYKPHGEQDARSVEVALDLRHCGSELPISLLEEVMASYAVVGDVANAERFLATYRESTPEPLRDLHIKAHIHALALYEPPTTVLKVLHHYKTLGYPVPQHSSTHFISKHLFIRSTVAHSQAWDLFSRIQYVYHPHPNAFLYATIIRACVSHILSHQPARALDLFMEMTVDRGIPPTTDAYNAAIFACACSYNRLCVGKASCLAKEMTTGSHDTYGKPVFTPNWRTFCALPESVKQIEDLANT